MTKLTVWLIQNLIRSELSSPIRLHFRIWNFTFDQIDWLRRLVFLFIVYLFSQAFVLLKTIYINPTIPAATPTQNINFQIFSNLPVTRFNLAALCIFRLPYYCIYHTGVVLCSFCPPVWPLPSSDIYFIIS